MDCRAQVRPTPRNCALIRSQTSASVLPGTGAPEVVSVGPATGADLPVGTTSRSESLRSLRTGFTVSRDNSPCVGASAAFGFATFENGFLNSVHRPSGNTCFGADGSATRPAGSSASTGFIVFPVRSNQLEGLWCQSGVALSDRFEFVRVPNLEPVKHSHEH